MSLSFFTTGSCTKIIIRTHIWVSKQLYMSAKQLIVGRKANAFNKAIKGEANHRREQGMYIAHVNSVC